MASSGGNPATVPLQGAGGDNASGSAAIAVGRHWTRLLETADNLHIAGHYGAAVVVAQAACEVVTERAMTKKFTDKKVPELASPIDKLLTSYSVKGEKNRDLYNALANDDIQQRPFWAGYCQLVEIQNDSVHSGNEPTQVASRNGIDAAKGFVAHVEGHNGLQG